jgi:hypothetical protein
MDHIKICQLVDLCGWPSASIAKRFLYTLFTYFLKLEADMLTHCCVWSSESSGMYYHVLNWMLTDVSEVRAAFIIALMMEAACTSQTSVDIQLRTRQYIPEDSELLTCHHENFKSHIVVLVTLNSQMFRMSSTSPNASLTVIQWLRAHSGILLPLLLVEPCNHVVVLCVPNSFLQHLCTSFTLSVFQ